MSSTGQFPLILITTNAILVLRYYLIQGFGLCGGQTSS